MYGEKSFLLFVNCLSEEVLMVYLNRYIYIYISPDIWRNKYFINCGILFVSEFSYFAFHPQKTPVNRDYVQQGDGIPSRKSCCK